MAIAGSMVDCICIHIARAWRYDDYEYKLEDYDSEEDCIQDILDNEIGLTLATISMSISSTI